MENAMLVGLSRQIALGRQLDVISNNLANVTTNGFKGRSSRFEEYTASLARAEGFRDADRPLSFVIDAGTPLDLSSGAIEMTGNALDIAIKGDSFFTVQTPNGERFTRNGALQLDAAGQLVTSDNYPILGDGGPITIGPQETNLSIAPDGTVSTSQGKRGRIRLVRFDDTNSLQNAGGNTFTSRAAPQPAGSLGRVEPGALERSNVKSIVEMTRLIEVNRAYTTVAGMIGRMDEMKRTTMQRLADSASS